MTQPGRRHLFMFVVVLILLSLLIFALNLNLNPSMRHHDDYNNCNGGGNSDSPSSIAKREMTPPCHHLVDAWMKLQQELGIDDVEFQRRFERAKRAKQLPEIPIVMYVHSRVEYFKRVLEGICRSPDMRKDRNILIVSFDGGHKDMMAALDEYADRPDCGFTVRARLVHNYDKGTRTTLRLTSHWYWLGQQLWDEPSNLLGDYDGDVLFFEEDTVPTADFYAVAKYLSSMKQLEADLHRVPIFGFSLNEFNGYGNMLQSKDPYQFKLKSNHNPPMLNQGYGFNRTMWNLIKAHSEHFTEADHPMSAWDNILGHLAQRCFLPGFVLLPSVPRTIHIGKNGGFIDSNYYDKVRMADANASTIFHFDAMRAYFHPLWTVEAQQNNRCRDPLMKRPVTGTCWECDKCKVCARSLEQQRRTGNYGFPLFGDTDAPIDEATSLFDNNAHADTDADADADANANANAGDDLDHH